MLASENILTSSLNRSTASTATVIARRSVLTTKSLAIADKPPDVCARLETKRYEAQIFMLLSRPALW